MRIRMGFLMSISSTARMEASTSFTSPLILATMSPRRSWVKKPSGRERILSYICILRSRTMPVWMGTIMAEEPK